MRRPALALTAIAIAVAIVMTMAVSLVAAAPAAEPVELPRANPTARASQMVGLTEIAVEYGSAAVKGRRIWGGVVPYDRPWALGIDRPATVRFSRDVHVAGQALRAGTYTLSAIPGKTTWTIVLEPGPIRVKVHPRVVPHRERLTLLFADFTDQGTSLDVEWERLRVSLPITTETAQQVQASLAELDDTWRSFANAARFMLETRKDFDAGLVYADRSLALKEDWYTLWIKAALLAAKHDYAGAVEAGERSHALGKKLGDGFVLGPELEKALGDWKKSAEAPTPGKK